MTALARALIPAATILALVLLSSQRQQDPTVAIEQLGGTVFRREGQVVEVNFNRTKVSDGDLRLLSGLTAMTDLSLEETAIGDAGLESLAPLKELRWLNLYRTRIGDAGLARLKSLEKLEHLPLGETRVTDAGLVHLSTCATSPISASAAMPSRMPAWLTSRGSRTSPACTSGRPRSRTKGLCT